MMERKTVKIVSIRRGVYVRQSGAGVTGIENENVYVMAGIMIATKP